MAAIIPILTYAAEGRNNTKEEMDNNTKYLQWSPENNIFLSQGTPTTFSSTKSGIPPTEDIVKNKPIMQAHRLINMKKNPLIRTRRSENDNIPQSLDEWTNSPLIGQQVGNCKSFTLTHYLADLFAMHRGPRSIPLCIQHHIQLTPLSPQVSRPSHYNNFNILPSKSKVKVMGEVKVSLTFYRLTSLSFHVNRPSHSWDTTFSKFDLENPRSRWWKRWTLTVTTLSPTFYRFTSLSFHVNRPS